METDRMRKENTSQSGFALLMTLIVVTVIISIGLTLLDLSVKQIRLSTNAKDSEIAFHAAYAGMECARYVMRMNADSMGQGAVITPSCFSGSVTSNTVRVIPQSQITGNGVAYLYNYSITWEDNAHCSQVTALVASSTTAGGGMTISGVGNGSSALVPGYPSGDTKTCGEGQQCSIISARGYNKPCNNDGTAPSSYGVVQREVLLQF
jgi:Tfp pilus assembly protein PilX